MGMLSSAYAKKKSVNLSSNSPLAMIVDEHEPILELREEVVAPAPGGTSESSIEKSSWVADKHCSTTVVSPKDNLLVKQRKGIRRISPSDARARIQDWDNAPKHRHIPGSIKSIPWTQKVQQHNSWTSLNQKWHLLWSFETRIVMVDVNELVEVTIVKVIDGEELDRKWWVVQNCSEIDETRELQLYAVCACWPLIEARNCGREDIFAEMQTDNTSRVRRAMTPDRNMWYSYIRMLFSHSKMAKNRKGPSLLKPSTKGSGIWYGSQTGEIMSGLAWQEYSYPPQWLR